jgi:hypothetical protein
LTLFIKEMISSDGGTSGELRMFSEALAYSSHFTIPSFPT